MDESLLLVDTEGEMYPYNEEEEEEEEMGPHNEEEEEEEEMGPHNEEEEAAHTLGVGEEEEEEEEENNSGGGGNEEDADMMAAIEASLLLSHAAAAPPMAEGPNTAVAKACVGDDVGVVLLLDDDEDEQSESKSKKMLSSATRNRMVQQQQQPALVMATIIDDDDDDDGQSPNDGDEDILAMYEAVPIHHTINNVAAATMMALPPATITANSWAIATSASAAAAANATDENNHQNNKAAATTHDDDDDDVHQFMWEIDDDDYGGIVDVEVDDDAFGPPYDNNNAHKTCNNGTWDCDADNNTTSSSSHDRHRRHSAREESVVALTTTSIGPNNNNHHPSASADGTFDRYYAPSLSFSKRRRRERRSMLLVLTEDLGYEKEVAVEACLRHNNDDNDGDGDGDVVQIHHRNHNHQSDRYRRVLAMESAVRWADFASGLVVIHPIVAASPNTSSPSSLVASSNPQAAGTNSGEEGRASSYSHEHPSSCAARWVATDLMVMGFGKSVSITAANRFDYLNSATTITTASAAAAAAVGSVPAARDTSRSLEAAMEWAAAAVEAYPQELSSSPASSSSADHHPAAAADSSSSAAVNGSGSNNGTAAIISNAALSALFNTVDLITMGFSREEAEPAVHRHPNNIAAASTEIIAGRAANKLIAMGFDARLSYRAVYDHVSAAEALKAVLRSEIHNDKCIRVLYSVDPYAYELLVFVFKCALAAADLHSKVNNSNNNGGGDDFKAKRVLQTLEPRVTNPDDPSRVVLDFSKGFQKELSGLSGKLPTAKAIVAARNQQQQEQVAVPRTAAASHYTLAGTSTATPHTPQHPTPTAPFSTGATTTTQTHCRPPNLFRRELEAVDPMLTPLLTWLIASNKMTIERMGVVRGGGGMGMGGGGVEVGGGGSATAALLRSSSNGDTAPKKFTHPLIPEFATCTQHQYFLRTSNIPEHDAAFAALKAKATLLELQQRVQRQQQNNAIRQQQTTEEGHQSYPSFNPAAATTWGFHGSVSDNWHSILRNGLESMSGTKYMLNGAASGEGVYFAHQLTRSMTYSNVTACPNATAASSTSSTAATAATMARNPSTAFSAIATAAGNNNAVLDDVLFSESEYDPSKCRIIAVCELITSELKNHGWCYTVKNKDAIAIRFLLLFPSSFGDFTAASSVSLQNKATVARLNEFMRLNSEKCE